VPELNFLYSKYEISNFGRIKNVKSSKILKPNFIQIYPQIRLTHNDKQRRTLGVHSLVCAVFHGPPKGDQKEVHHKNSNKIDFSAENLKWVNSSENIKMYYQKFKKIQRGVPVFKLNQQDEIVEEFDSISKAARAIGIPQSSMNFRVKTKKLYNNCYWTRKTVKNLENEIWKICKDDPQIFVSNMGRFKCVKHHTPIKVFSRNLYLKINKRGGKAEALAAHRIVASSFFSNPENKPCVDHIDGNKLNNEASNLRWVTHEENVANPNTTKNKKVLQKCSRTEKVINKFPSMGKAAEYIEGTASSISIACKRAPFKTYKGYIWEHDQNS
jgi:hypothetical protein